MAKNHSWIETFHDGLHRLFDEHVPRNVANFVEVITSRLGTDNEKDVVYAEFWLTNLPPYMKYYNIDMLKAALQDAKAKLNPNKPK
ncbi:MAG: hypothetical protein WC471_03345 [Candidatus Woesearchaeota archaeon]